MYRAHGLSCRGGACGLRVGNKNRARTAILRRHGIHERASRRSRIQPRAVAFQRKCSAHHGACRSAGFRQYLARRILLHLCDKRYDDLPHEGLYRVGIHGHDFGNAERLGRPVGSRSDLRRGNGKVLVLFQRDRAIRCFLRVISCNFRLSLRSLRARGLFGRG